MYGGWTGRLRGPEARLPREGTDQGSRAAAAEDEGQCWGAAGQREGAGPPRPGWRGTWTALCLLGRQSRACGEAGRDGGWALAAGRSGAERGCGHRLPSPGLSGDRPQAPAPPRRLVRGAGHAAPQSSLRRAEPQPSVRRGPGLSSSARRRHGLRGRPPQPPRPAPGARPRPGADRKSAAAPRRPRERGLGCDVQAPAGVRAGFCLPPTPS